MTVMSLTPRRCSSSATILIGPDADPARDQHRALGPRLRLDLVAERPDEVDAAALGHGGQLVRPGPDDVVEDRPAGRHVAVADDAVHRHRAAQQRDDAVGGPEVDELPGADRRRHGRRVHLHDVRVAGDRAVLEDLAQGLLRELGGDERRRLGHGGSEASTYPAHRPPRRGRSRYCGFRTISTVWPAEAEAVPVAKFGRPSVSPGIWAFARSSHTPSGTPRIDEVTRRAPRVPCAT